MMQTWKSVACVLLLMGCAGTNATHDKMGADDAAREQRIVVVSPRLDQAPEPVGGRAALRAAVTPPEEVLKQHKTATVLVEAHIDINGRVVGTKVAKSSGYEGMDAAAMIAVARVQWKPGRKKGEPFAATIRVPVQFGVQN